MRGKVARQMRQMVRHIFTDEKVWCSYEYKKSRSNYHAGEYVETESKVKTLTPDCGRALYQGAKLNYKRA